MLSSMQLDMLVPLESLLEHDSMRVQTYANAALFSLLRDPDIRYLLCAARHQLYCSTAVQEHVLAATLH